MNNNFLAALLCLGIIGITALLNYCIYGYLNNSVYTNSLLIIILFYTILARLEKL